ncbi:MAG: phosphoribosylaminoimidazolesuccinocarboxamide synthase [Thermoguttaceae bacterium]
MTSIPNITPRSGKVRDIYDLGDTLLLVASDRISAFDWVLPTLVPDKGKVLTQISEFWFRFLGVPNHLITTDVASMTLPPGSDHAALVGRSMLTRKCKVLPVECIVRGYLSGSGWKEYQNHGTVCGIKLPSGLVESDKLPEPIFTPSTKAETGHDENITFDECVKIVGRTQAEELQKRSLDIFRRGSDYAAKRGVIIADTKFEFGVCGDELLLIDEVLTPDSSRFWPASEYVAGRGQPSFDKQFVRDWLLASSWDRKSTPPALPADVIEKTRAKYIEAFEKITDQRPNL